MTFKNFIRTIKKFGNCAIPKKTPENLFEFEDNISVTWEELQELTFQLCKKPLKRMKQKYHYENIILVELSRKEELEKLNNE
jgi:hypothetical protein